MFVYLITLLNGQGGSVEQTYAYLDPKSALNWFGLSNQSSYSTVYRESLPLGPLAAKMLERDSHGRMDIIALGAGDGKQEVRLVQHLLEQIEGKSSKAHADLSLYLVDISQPLLSEALRHANTSLVGRSVMTVWAVQGNFHHLPRDTQLHYAPQPTEKDRNNRCARRGSAFGRRPMGSDRAAVGAVSAPHSQRTDIWGTRGDCAGGAAKSRRGRAAVAPVETMSNQAFLERN